MGKEGVGERVGDRKILGAGVIPKFVVFSDFTLFLCSSVQ